VSVLAFKKIPPYKSVKM